MSLHLKSVHVWCACQNYADLLGIRVGRHMHRKVETPGSNGKTIQCSLDIATGLRQGG